MTHTKQAKAPPPLRVSDPERDHGSASDGRRPAGATHRYHTLDAIRGLAAIYVLMGHASDLFSPLPHPRFWLAVDLFFLMSGFVLSRVYEPRFAAGMTTRQFMIQRYVRLYPLYFAGFAIGFLSAAGALAMHKGDLSPTDLAIATVTGLFILPSPTWASQLDIIPLNFPGWSLFFELLVNLVFVVLWRWLSVRVLMAIVASAALALVIGFWIGIPTGGEGWNTVAWGIPRITFSFFLGVLISRHQANYPIRRSGLAWVLSLVPAILLWWYPPHGALLDAALIFVGFPLLLIACVRVEPRQLRIADRLGAISYPLYILHMPILSLLWRGMLLIHRSPATAAPLLGWLYLGAMVSVASFADRHYDRPVRTKLIGWLARRPRQAQRDAAVATPL